jgi:hypothetical protein
MIEKHNFFEKDLNEGGDFPNDFVDNGDGTVTDRVTRLMWEKGGSSSTLYISKAEKYVSRLNKERFLGQNDWRIPSLEELCSLVEQKVNERGQHISSLFKDKQSKCLSTDLLNTEFMKHCNIHNFVNFTKGNIDDTPTENKVWCKRMLTPVFSYIRAVRSIK